MKLLELVRSEAVVANLTSKDRNGVIRELVASLASAGAIAENAVEPIAKSIIQRERTRGTTGFGKGVAAPHGKIDGLTQ